MSASEKLLFLRSAPQQPRRARDSTYNLKEPLGEHVGNI